MVPFVGWLHGRLESYEIALIVPARDGITARAIVTEPIVELYPVQSAELRRIPRVQFYGAEYPVPRMLDSLLKLAEQRGAPDDARELLEELTGVSIAPCSSPPSDVLAAPIPVSTLDRGSIIRTLSLEFDLDPGKIRAKLRGAGISAPYTDLQLCRSKLK